MRVPRPSLFGMELDQFDKTAFSADRSITTAW